MGFSGAQAQVSTHCFFKSHSSRAGLGCDRGQLGMRGTEGSTKETYVMEPTVIAEGMNAPQALDFSLYGLWLKADIVVKSVMGILIFASFWSWAIMIDKWFSMGRVRRKADKFENAFWSGKPLEELYRQLGSKARSSHGLGVWRSDEGVAPVL